MTAISPRRFTIAAAPSPLAWIAQALNRAFTCPTEPSTALERVVERLRPR